MAPLCDGLLLAALAAAVWTLRARWLSARRKEAAATIQAQMRSRAARLAQARRVLARRRTAAITIQAAARDLADRLLIGDIFCVAMAAQVLQRFARPLARLYTDSTRTASTLSSTPGSATSHHPCRAACKIQAAARGSAARRHRGAEHLLPHPRPECQLSTPPRAHAAAERLTMDPEDDGELDSAPRTAQARRTRKRGGGAKAQAKKAAASAGLQRWPHALPGVLNFRTPATPCGSGYDIVMMLFTYMMPMADFPEAKCDVLRRVIVARLERIGTRPGLLCVILGAIKAELSVKSAHRERHAGDNATPIVRFLGTTSSEWTILDASSRLTESSQSSCASLRATSRVLPSCMLPSSTLSRTTRAAEARTTTSPAITRSLSGRRLAQLRAPMPSREHLHGGRWGNVVHSSSLVRRGAPHVSARRGYGVRTLRMYLAVLLQFGLLGIGSRLHDSAARQNHAYRGPDGS